MIASTTNMKRMDIDYSLTFESVAAGTWMRWSGHVRPKGVLRLLRPLITWMGARQEQQDPGRLKMYLAVAR